MTVLKIFVSKDFIEHIFFLKNIKRKSNFPVIMNKYCWYPSFWLLTFGGFAGHDITFSEQFLLGKKIAQVWEEEEFLVSSVR